MIQRLKEFALYLWSMREVLLAGIFTGAESLVSMGIDLPGSKSLDPWLRAMLYFSIMGGAFIFRWIAMRKARANRDSQTP
jgi:disulfide oxidoreductase YuzD